MKMKSDILKDCVLCGGRFSEWGNNPAPIKDHGQCCDHCNRTKVIPERFQRLQEARSQQNRNNNQ
jgi:hypothetical protein